MSPPSSASDEAARRAGLPPGYRLHEARLKNGVAIAAVQAPGTRLQRLVAAVGAGYLDEPDDCRGLAHLLEHALFLGSAGFPEAGELARWVSERGGRYNARTDATVTDVHLHLPPGDSNEGLRRLVDMLARPRFKAEYIAHEIAVLDAEFHARLDDPALHRLAALGRLCRRGHPARRCHAGNRATLGDDAARLRDRLVDFHQRHYRAGRMALVMLGPLPLDEQLALLERHASTLSAEERASANSTLTARTWCWGEPGGVAWRPPAAGPEVSSLELFWPLPEAYATAHDNWLAGVAARLADGQLAATLQAAVNLTRLDVTLALKGVGPALALQLAPARELETVQTMVGACHAALEQALASPMPVPFTALPDLDAWPRQRAAQLTQAGPQLAHSGEDDTSPDESARVLLPWLAPGQCRLLWQSPATPGRWSTLAETDTQWHHQPLPSVNVPLPERSAPALALRPIRSSDNPSPPRLLSRDEQFRLWAGEPSQLASCLPASLCLGWPAPVTGQPERLAKWHHHVLPLRQAAHAHGMQLTLAGDAHGDWLLAMGLPERLGALVELAVACWPQAATQTVENPREGLLAQRMLAKLESLPPPGQRPDAPHPWLGWACGGADVQAAEATLKRLAGQRTAGPPTPASVDLATSHDDTCRLPPQSSDQAVMLEVIGPDGTPRSRWLMRLLAQCHDAAFHHEMRQRRGLGYVAAVRYRESCGFPRLGYVVQSPGFGTDTLRQAILHFLAQHAEAFAKLSCVELVRQRQGLLAHVGHPETPVEATTRLWQALRRHAATGSALPWQPLPWEAEAQALEALKPDDIVALAGDLAAGRLLHRWWLHDSQ